MSLKELSPNGAVLERRTGSGRRISPECVDKWGHRLALHDFPWRCLGDIGLPVFQAVSLGSELRVGVDEPDGDLVGFVRVRLPGRGFLPVRPCLEPEDRGRDGLPVIAGRLAATR